MFDAVAGIKFGYILCGIIWSIALGFAAGNYACSLVHRLPRGRLLLDKKPYCGTCGTLLQVRDLFPVVSAMMLRHRCRYCGTPFPVSHTWTELLVGLLFVLSFLKYGFSEQYFLIVGIGVFLITLAAIEANEGMVMNKILIVVAIFGMLYRTLQDHTIYGFFMGAIIGLFISAVIWRKQIKPEAHIYIPPTPVVLITAGALCVGDHGIFFFLALFAAFYALDWLVRKIAHAKKPPLITVSFGLATILLVLYPVQAATITDPGAPGMQTCSQLVKTIKTGMPRHDVEIIAQYDGGVQGHFKDERMLIRNFRDSAGRACKVPVSFRPAKARAASDKEPEQSPDDTVRKVGAPYLQRMVSD